MTAKRFNTWERRINRLKMEAYAIYLAYKDPRVPWYAKILIVCIIGYAFSPIDKVLKSIPILGYVDHLILVPLGAILAFKKMIPSAVLTHCRKIAINRTKPANWVHASVAVFILLLAISLGIISTLWTIRDWNLVLGQWFKWVTRITLRSEPNVR